MADNRRLKNEFKNKFLRLVIDDRRSILSTTSTSQRVDVKFIDCDQCMNGEWRANASELLIALQNSIGRLAGSGRIGVPDRLDSSYTEYFVEMITDEPTNILTTNPQFLIVPKDNRLNFRVDLIAGRHPESTVNSQSLIQPASASLMARPGGSESTPRASRRQPTEPEIEWLKRKIGARPGYVKFNASHNKVLQNIERVGYWRFASDVKREFHKKTWPSEVSSSSSVSIFP
ncbi:hypothetical protein B0H13DRAFT_1871641 [Mycena leptocephala]|nr:hypothetical protein B0H13DRAFT_1871641 [Mycena leptocephala]